MGRTLLLTTLHKGLRRLLFEDALAVAAADFGDPVEAAAAVRRVRGLLARLADHDRLEEALVLPVLAAAAPEMAADLRVEHARLGGLGKELEELAGRLDPAPEAHRRALGRRLEDRLGRLVAAHLLHLANVETDVLRVLGAHLDDEALRGLQRRLIVGTPEHPGGWVAVALPAVHRSERRAVLVDLRESLSADDFAAATAGARAVLGAAAWAEALGS